MADTQTATAEKTEEEKQAEAKAAEEKAAQDKAQWDKDRQRADQLDANLKKVIGERDDLKGRVSDQETRLKEVETELKAKQGSEAIEFADIDPETADITDLVKERRQLIDVLKENRETLIQQGAELDKLKGENERRAKEAEEEKAREELLKPLDAEYGAKFRNVAIEFAQTEVDRRGYPPKTDVEAYRLLEKGYKEAKAASEKSSKDTKKKGVAVDTGAGGVSAPTERKPGRHQDVLADMRASGKYAGEIDFEGV